MKLNSFYLIILLLTCTILTNRSNAQSPNQNIRFEVLSTEVSVSVVGANKTLSWEDNENFKPVILHIKAIFPDDIELFASDFSISYFLDDEGTWDRSRCQGISTIVSSAEDEPAMIIDTYAHAKGKKGTRYFKAFFAIEDGVDKITLLYAEPAAKDIIITR